MRAYWDDLLPRGALYFDGLSPARCMTRIRRELSAPSFWEVGLGVRPAWTYRGVVLVQLLVTFAVGGDDFRHARTLLQTWFSDEGLTVEEVSP